MSEQHSHENMMTNSHILVQGFDYFEPTSMEEAIAQLQECGPRARLIAGGTHLLVVMKMEREIPSALISLDKIPGLDGIETLADGGLAIGARASIRAIREHPRVRQVYPALSSACASFGSTQIEVMASLGGNVCNGSPASDTIPALLVYGAQLEISGPDSDRRVALDAFLLGPGKVALQPGEILRRVVLPGQPEGAASEFVKLSRVAADLAKASMAMLVVRDGERIAECRVAMGSVSAVVKRLRTAEMLLEGKQFSPELLTAAGEAAAQEISPIDDIRSTAWYRRRMAGVLLQDLFSMLWEKTVSAPLALPAALPKNGHRPLTQPNNLNESEQKEIELTVNGRKTRLWVSAHDLLLNVLREKLELTGAKYGCGVGECGACSVMIDGQPAFSCLTLAVSAAGKEVTTVEGLQRPNGEPDTIQQTFIDETAFQCGYCTPGFLMTARALLNEIPRPSEAEVREYLKGNRCRCTGYHSIVRAVLSAAQREHPDDNGSAGPQ